MTKNRYSYEINNGSVSGAFNVYQAKDGKVYIVMGNGHTALNHEQILDLHIDVFSLVDFDYDEYQKAYR